MTNNFNLSEQVNLLLEEVNKFKWIESEKKGYDIGMSYALKEWINLYYDKWFEEYRKNKNLK